MRAFVLFATMFIAACDGAPSSDAVNGGAPADYDAMNEVARGPGHPIEPQSIRVAELENRAPFECVVLGGAESEVLFIASTNIGAMQIDGERIQFSPVPSADPLPFEISDRFDGKAYRVELARDHESEAPVQPEVSTFTGRMRVRDEHRRVVFDEPAVIRCSANG